MKKKNELAYSRALVPKKASLWKKITIWLIMMFVVIIAFTLFTNSQII